MNLQGGWRSSIDLSAISGGLNFRGTWDAATNTPTLSDGGGGGAQGDYFIVSVAGATTIDGISDWEVGDWIINSGSAWQKIDNTDLVQSVNGDTGVVIVDLESALAQNSSTGSYNISIDSGQNITWNAGLGGALTSAATTGAIKNWILPDLSGTIALTSQIPSTAIVDDRIPIGNAAGTGIEDGTWSIVGNDLIPVTNGSNIGASGNGVGTLFMTGAINWVGAFAQISSLTQDRLRLENSNTYMQWGNSSEGYGIGINQASDASSLFSLSSTTQGFLTPRMTTFNQNAITSPTESLLLYNEDDNTHTYNHPVDGFVPIGRYSGNPHTSASATNGQVQAVNKDGEFVQGRLRVTGNQVLPLNSIGVQTDNSVSLGAASLRFLEVYGTRFNAPLSGTNGYQWQGSDAKITAQTGTGAGMALTGGSDGSKAHISGVNDQGVLISDTTLTAGAGTVGEDHVALVLRGNGMMQLPPRAGSVVEGLSGFATLPDGTCVNIGTADGVILNLVGLWFKKAGTWTFIA